MNVDKESEMRTILGGRRGVCRIAGCEGEVARRKMMEMERNIVFGVYDCTMK